MTLPSAMVCSACGHGFAVDVDITQCNRCGGVLRMEYDFDQIALQIDRSTLETRMPGIWRYIELLPVVDSSDIVTLGEGGTTLHRSSGLARRLGSTSLFLKDETTNPTGAFIDRGTSVEVSRAQSRGIRTLTVGSTGNLAASLVAYCAKAGLKSRVFLPQKQRMDTGKLYQILAFGSEVELVRDSEESRAKAAAVRGKTQVIRASSPYFMEGIKTTAYEILEQLKWESPDWVLVPVGNGCHLSMIWRGLIEFRELGFVDTIRTRLVGTQATSCAPIVEAFDSKSNEIMPSDVTSSVATDIAFVSPSCGSMALDAITESGGLAVSVSDKEILDAVGNLARYEGLFAEPASATTIAVLSRLLRNGTIGKTDRVVCIITGMGLKYPEIAETFVRKRADLQSYLMRTGGRSLGSPLGRTKTAILQILSEDRSYGYGIWKTLSEQLGVSVSVPTVYQHLDELTEAGLITRSVTEQVVGGRVRNYYSLTERGRWSVNHGHLPRSNQGGSLCD